MRNIRELKEIRRSKISINRLESRAYLSFCVKTFNMREWWRMKYYFTYIYWSS